MSGGSTEELVASHLRQYAAALHRRDRDAVLAMYTDDPIAIGSGADEWASGKVALGRGLDRDLSQTGEVNATFGAPEVGRRGEVIWLAVPAAVTAEVEGGPITIHGRLTAVLVEKGQNWLIAQSHFSVPAADQAEGQSFPSLPSA